MPRVWGQFYTGVFGGACQLMVSPNSCFFTMTRPADSLNLTEKNRFKFLQDWKGQFRPIFSDMQIG